MRLRNHVEIFKKNLIAHLEQLKTHNFWLSLYLPSLMVVLLNQLFIIATTQGGFIVSYVLEI